MSFARLSAGMSFRVEKVGAPSVFAFVVVVAMRCSVSNCSPESAFRVYRPARGF